jgi:hypothetical protein
MTTELPRHQSFAAFRLGSALRWRVPLHTRTAVTEIRGRRRVEAVVLCDLETGRETEVACDLVVFTADWIPDHELAVLGGAALDRGTRGPAVDAAGRTDRPGLFATGNLLHGAETADVAALTGRHVARGVLRHLGGEPWPAARVPVVCEAPLQWVAPNAISAGGPTATPARGRFLLRAARALADVRVQAVQDGRTLWDGWVPRVLPGRSARLPAGWAGGTDPGGGPVALRVVRARSRG